MPRRFSCAWLKRQWGRLPFRHVILLVLGLAVVGEFYPFSNFPMYSNIVDEADVVYVTDQNDRILPMQVLFRTASSSAKKTYKRNLRDLCGPAGRSTDEATAAERAEAGRVTLAALHEDFQARRKKMRHLPVEGVTRLRLYARVFGVRDGGIAMGEPEKLAECDL